MDWDDLRYVLAVHKAGSVAGAARVLRLNQVTVFRRIEKIEKGLGVRLFDRRQKGYVATPVGQEIVEEAGQVEDRINALERRVWRQDTLVQGTVRLTTTDTIATMVLPAIAAELQAAHPLLRLEVMISQEVLNLTKRDADIAIRHALQPPEALIGHRIATVKYAVYCAAKKKYRGGRPDLAAQLWVAPNEARSEHRVNNWLREQGHEPRVAYRCDSYVAEAMAVRAGAGVGLLSCFVADSLDGLRRLTPPVDDVENQYWALTHPELRAVARIATVYAAIRKSFAALKPLFAGDTRPVG